MYLPPPSISINRKIPVTLQVEEINSILKAVEMKKEHFVPLVSIKLCNVFSVENFPSEPIILIGFFIEL